WLALVAATGLVMLIPSLSDHPTVLATVWLLGIVIGIAVVAWGLMPRAAPIPQSSRQAAAPVAVRIGTQSYLAAGAIVVVAGLALLSQWQFQTAAIADPLGFRNLTHGSVVAGIGNLQQAVQLEDDLPKYQQDLASVYTGLAGVSSQGSQLGLVLGPDASSTIDPNLVLTLGSDQLFTLGVQALDAAHRSAPLDPSIDDALGNAYLQWKQPALAFAAFQEAERLSLHNPKYLDGEARAELAQGKAQSAISRAQDAVRLDHTYWFSHYTLALIYHQLNDRAQARREAQLGLYWEPVFWPPPPKNQVAQLQTIQATG
ncbi:MAG TPA: hypothetical protein VF221_01135, partial [Chloroflexota bacterium]